jgi:hypothetical protein
MSSNRATPKRASNTWVILAVAGIAILALILLAVAASSK